MISPTLLWLIGIVAVLFLALIGLTLLCRRPLAYPYRKRKALLSPAERSFLGVLEQALGADYRIFAKVRVADVIGVRSGLARSAYQSAMIRIKPRHFDFVLCAPEDLSVIGAIELDDASHEGPRRQARDAFLVAACAAAGLPLVKVRAASTYPVGEIRGKIMDRLAGPRRLTAAARPHALHDLLQVHT
jgi:uncharacterized protein DUF2726